MEKGRKLSASETLLYYNSCLITGNIDKIEKLKNYTEKMNPPLYKKMLLEFIVPFIKNAEADKIAAFLEPHINSKIKNVLWLRWQYAFSIIVLGRREEALQLLSDILVQTGSPLLKLMTVYIMDTAFGPLPQTETFTEEFKNPRLVDKIRKDFAVHSRVVHMIILTRIYDDALKWASKFSSEK
jgi:hypothetical protein